MSTTALIMKARSHYGCNRFDEVVAWYMLHGYIYIGPDAVILAQPQNKASLLGMDNCLDKIDCWYIQYATGNKKRFFDVCPFDLEWVVFERRDEANRKVYKFETLKKRLCYGNETRTT
jgi:hypothetical protein